LQQASGDSPYSAISDLKRLSAATVLSQLPFPLIEAFEQVDA
jgi:hypothetical protein